MFNSIQLFRADMKAFLFLLLLVVMTCPSIGRADLAPDGTTAIAPNYGGGVPPVTPSDTAEASGVALTSQHTKTLDAINQLATGGGGVETCVPGYTAAQQQMMAFDQAWQTCNTQQPLAANACLESLSPEIKKAASGLSMLGSVMSATGASANQKCSQMGSLMDMLKNGLTAYATACAATKTACVSSCGKATDLLAKASKQFAALQAIEPNPEQPICGSYISALPGVKSQVQSYSQAEAVKTTDPKPLAGKLALCSDSYQQMIGTAGAGIASAATTMGQSSQCAKDTNGTGQQAALDCSNPANAQNQVCLCQKNPRLQGCSNSLEKVGGSVSSGGFSGANASGLGVTGGGTGSGLDMGSLGSGTQGTTNAEKAKDDGANGLPPGGGGGGGLGGFGSGGGGSGGAAGSGGIASKASGVNVLAGESGGGGGFGGGFRSGGSSDTLKGYMPGGVNDPQRGLAGVMMKQVTPQVGKSNWEKVNERYRDNKPSLIGE